MKHDAHALISFARRSRVVVGRYFCASVQPTGCEFQKIRDLLEVRGVGANFANDRGVRPMHIACQTGDMRLVQRLLELGEATTLVSVNVVVATLGGLANQENCKPGAFVRRHR